MSEAQTTETQPPESRPGEKMSFQAEVSRLLDIVAHSLYSEKEIFLRELISNASDACDRLRYAAITQPDLAEGGGAYTISLGLDKEARTLTVADNGIGMSKAEIVDNLGTIARSGTSAFLNQLSGDAKKDVALIGQFGVGFYSAFMVADKVEVLARKAGEREAWLWSSDGKGEFTVTAAEKSGRGTAVVLHLKAEDGEFLEPMRLREIVKRYSDHIQVPIELTEGGKPETLNAASALWSRPKSEITEQQYREFYRHVAHALDQPWLTIHHKAEGTIEYTSLLYVPESKPFDLFHPDRRHRVKLYLKRVYITDDCKELVPTWLRFLRGVVDTPDLALNVSREMLQKSPLMAKIRGGITKRVLSELQKQADADQESYGKFWENFGAVLKEGLYEDRGEHRDAILKLSRFHSTNGPALASLAQYIARMKDGQDAIYTISGEELDALRASPQLEGFAAKGVEVLLLTDPIDEFWVSTINDYEGKPFKSATRGGVDLAKIKSADKPLEPEAATDDIGALLAMFKLALGDSVKDVRKTERLTDSAVCLVADEHDLDMRLERMLRQHKQLEAGFKRILEVNPKHKLVRKLAQMASRKGAAPVIEESAKLLLDQARIVEGEPVPDPKAFAKRLADMLERGLVA
ncbi:MAG: molecular chaperone HtpG [Proteobacteria bacterium]|nr:molecular chaperone HtpG [Pseudomonadota bacterium]MBI3495699.1 molecular chaperone HtpG [Pseudomonadota bacterium]